MNTEQRVRYLATSFVEALIRSGALVDDGEVRGRPTMSIGYSSLQSIADTFFVGHDVTKVDGRVSGSRIAFAAPSGTKDKEHVRMIYRAFEPALDNADWSPEMLAD